MKKHETVRVGVFDEIADADAAVHLLVEAGFSKHSISVICPTCAKGAFSEYEREDPAGSSTPAAVATGGAIGSVLGGLSAAAGIAATGGVGLLVVGPILGAAAGGGVAGGFIGAMTTRGFEPEIADYYDQALQRGSVLVAVESSAEDPSSAEAERALERAGAEPFELRKS